MKYLCCAMVSFYGTLEKTSVLCLKMEMTKVILKLWNYHIMKLDLKIELQKTSIHEMDVVFFLQNSKMKYLCWAMVSFYGKLEKTSALCLKMEMPKVILTIDITKLVGKMAKEGGAWFMTVALTNTADYQIDHTEDISVF